MLVHSMLSFVCTLHMFVHPYVEVGSAGHSYHMSLLKPHVPVVLLYFIEQSMSNSETMLE